MECMRDPRLTIRLCDIREVEGLAALVAEADVTINAAWYEHNITGHACGYEGT